MKKVFEWLKASNRWKHLLGGLCIGFCANSWYCAAYAGTLTAAAMEYKDKAHGGKWDWIDFSLSAGGAVVGQLISSVL